MRRLKAPALGPERKNKRKERSCTAYTLSAFQKAYEFAYSASGLDLTRSGAQDFA